MGMGFFGKIGRTQQEIDEENAKIHAAYQRALANFDAYIREQARLKGEAELSADAFIADATGIVDTASTPLLPDEVSTNFSNKTVQELRDMRNEVVRCVNDHNNPRVKEVMARALKATQAYADPIHREANPEVAKEYTRSHWAVTRLGDAAKGVSFGMLALGGAGYVLGAVLIGTGVGALLGLALMLGSTFVFLTPAMAVAAFTRGQGTESLDRERVGREMSVVKSSPGVR